MKLVLPVAAAAAVAVASFAQQVVADGDSPKPWSCPNIDGELRISDRIVVCASQQPQLCLGVLGDGVDTLKKDSSIGLVTHKLTTEKEQDATAWTFRCNEEEGHLHLQHPFFEGLCLGTKDNQLGHLLPCDGDHDGGQLVHVAPLDDSIHQWQLVLDNTRSAQNTCLVVGQELGNLASYTSIKDSKTELLSRIVTCNSDVKEAMFLGQHWVSRDMNDEAPKQSNGLRAAVKTPVNIFKPVNMQTQTHNSQGDMLTPTRKEKVGMLTPTRKEQVGMLTQAQKRQVDMLTQAREKQVELAVKGNNTPDTMPAVTEPMPVSAHTSTQQAPATETQQAPALAVPEVADAGAPKQPALAVPVVSDTETQQEPTVAVPVLAETSTQQQPALANPAVVDTEPALAAPVAPVSPALDVTVTQQPTALTVPVVPEITTPQATNTPTSEPTSNKKPFDMKMAVFLLALLGAVVIIRRRYISDNGNEDTDDLRKGGPYQVVSAADGPEYFDEDEFGDDHYVI